MTLTKEGLIKQITTQLETQYANFEVAGDMTAISYNHGRISAFKQMLKFIGVDVTLTIEVRGGESE